MSRLKRFHVIIFLLLLILFQVSLGQNSSSQPFFKHISVADGLPSRTVYQVLQDKKGYLWFATENGVSRFNGRNFTNFSISDGLPELTVLRILEDAAGRIWFLSSGGSLSYFFDGKFLPYRFNEQILKFLKGNNYTSFHVTADDEVYIAGFFQGSIKIDKNGKVSAFQKTEKALLLNQFGNTPYLFSSVPEFYDSLKVYYSGRNTHNFFFKSGKENEVLSTTRWIQSQNGSTWGTAMNKLVYITSNNVETIELDIQKAIIWISETKQGKILAGLHKGGLIFFDPVNRNQFRCLEELSVTSCHEDLSGGLWITTIENGIYYWPFYKPYIFKDQTRYASVTAGNGRVYGATSGGRITEYYKGEFASKKWLNKEDASTLYSIRYNEKNKGVYVCTSEESVLVRDKAKNSFPFPGSSVLTQVNDSCLLAGRWDHLGLLAKSGNTELIYNTGRISSIFKSSDSSIWVGSSFGLKKFILAGNKLQKQSSNKIFEKRITDITEYKNYLFAGTKGNGLIVWDRKKDSVLVLNSSNGLNSNTIHKLFMYESTLYAATGQGLFVINIKSVSPLKMDLSSYSISPVLTKEEINDIVIYNDTVWIASNSGLVFFPVYLKNPNETLSVDINSLFLSGKRIPIGKLNHEFEYNSSIRIGYDVANVSESGEIFYRYRMGGNQKEWSEAKGSELVIPELNPGEYSFQISASVDGVSWSKPSEFNFSVVAPYWKTSYFQGGMSIAVFGLLIFGFKIREKRIRKKEAFEKERLREMLSLELSALRAQMNPHFLFNCLASIQQFLFTNDPLAASQYLSKFSRLIRTLLEHARAQVVTLDEEIKALTVYIELEQLRLDHKFDFNISTLSIENLNEIKIPPLIIQPFVENAIWHGLSPLESKGVLKISFSVKENYLICLVEDNGVGRETSLKIKKENRSSRGIEIIERKLQLHNADKVYLPLVINDLYDELGNSAGTQVILKIALNENSYN